MAETLVVDIRLELNGVQLEGYTDEAILELETKVVETTPAGGVNGGWARNKPSIKSWKMTGKIFSDPAAAASDATLFTAFGALVTAKFRFTSAAIGAGNPEYQGSGILRKVTPIGGKVGDQMMNSWELIGSGSLTRATS